MVQHDMLTQSTSTADRTKPIRQRAANLVQEAILRGHLQPGDEISQLALARELGLSQASLREALQELEHRGLLRKRGRTWLITRLSEDELCDLYQIRVVLEPLACGLAACSFTQQLGAQLDECLQRMTTAATALDYPEHSRADIEFHQLIWKSQPNRLLEKHLNLLCLPLFAYDLVKRTELVVLDFERSLRQHHLIVNLLRTRDSLRTERLVRRLMRTFHRHDIADFRRIEAQYAGSGRTGT
jgi:DNA-binding GntR family transcriptional regulator